MSSSSKNLSVSEGQPVPNAGPYRFGIVCAEWNSEVTGKLLEGAVETLTRAGASKTCISVQHVPGSFELTLGARYLAAEGRVDAIICLGCVIQGETRHFDFICNAVANGLTQLNIEYGIPVIFGVLTPENQQQALDRAGGKHGNKGDEAAMTAVKMLALRDRIRDEKS